MPSSRSPPSSRRPASSPTISPSGRPSRRSSSCSSCSSAVRPAPPAAAIKCVRILLILKHGYRELYRLIHPHAVTQVKLDHMTVPPDVMKSIWGFFALYIGLAILATIADVLPRARHAHLLRLRRRHDRQHRTGPGPLPSRRRPTARCRRWANGSSPSAC